MLGVFLLPAFTLLDLGLYSHPKEFFGGMESKALLTPREKSYRKKNPQRRIDPTTLAPYR